MIAQGSWRGSLYVTCRGSHKPVFLHPPSRPFSCQSGCSGQPGDPHLDHALPLHARSHTSRLLLNTCSAAALCSRTAGPLKPAGSVVACGRTTNGRFAPAPVKGRYVSVEMRRTVGSATSQLAIAEVVVFGRGRSSAWEEQLQFMLAQRLEVGGRTAWWIEQQGSSRRCAGRWPCIRVGVLLCALAHVSAARKHALPLRLLAPNMWLCAVTN